MRVERSSESLPSTVRDPFAVADEARSSRACGNVRSRRIVILTATIGVLALVGILWPSVSGAQVVVRPNRASLQIPVVIRVGVRLHVSQRASAAFVATTPSYSEVELPLTAAANVPWTLGISLPDAESQGVVLAIRNADGAWEAPALGRPVSVLTRQEPANPHEVLVRIRIARGTPADRVERLRLHLDAAEGRAP